MEQRQLETMRRYLLGELSEAEQEMLESQYLNDDEAFEEMVRIENQLVDSYVQDRLAPVERARFEQHYLAHPERRERVKFAQALQQKIQSTRRAEAGINRQTDSASLWQKIAAFLRGENLGLVAGFAAALLLLTVGITYYFRFGQDVDPNIARVSPPPASLTPSPIIPSTTPGTSETPKSSPTKSDPGQKPTELPTPILPTDQAHAPPDIAQVSPPSATAFLLLTANTSSANAPTLTLPVGASQARLQLNLSPQNYATYQANVRADNGEEIWSQPNLPPRPTNDGVSFILMIPASRLTTGTYQLSLSGITDKGEATEITKSFFKIEKRKN